MNLGINYIRELGTSSKGQKSRFIDLQTLASTHNIQGIYLGNFYEEEGWTDSSYLQQNYILLYQYQQLTP